jgi:uncharacterized membrane protein
LVGIDTSGQIGAELYSDAVDLLQIPDERRGVPTLVMGDAVLVGGLEIPEKLPGLIDQGLAQGGIGWPDIPGLRDAIPDLPPSSRYQESSSMTESLDSDQDVSMTGNSSVASDSLSEDPIGLAIAWIVLTFMTLSLIYAISRIWPNPFRLLTATTAEELSNWTIPIISIAGFLIAAYLAYVEISRVEAVCGPIGECNIVQSSQYAQIVGIPVAVLGLLFYLAILGSWLLIRFVKKSWIKWIPLLLLASAFLGTLFSVYLTMMELLVIRAICAWCLSSAIITTTLLLFVVSKFKVGERKLKLKGESEVHFPH